MLGIRTRALTGIALLAAVCGLNAPAQAQFFNSGCSSCGTAPAPRMAPIWNQGACAPVYQSACAPVCQTVAVAPCPTMRPVTETVYNEVDVVQYRPVKKTVKVAKVETVMEERQVVSYQTVNEVKTVNVPSYVNQTVNECRQVTQNKSYWRTTWQPNPKTSPCQYDCRPGLVGELNRLGYAFRNSITPNAYARREYVPNVVAYNVPVQRTVQVPTTRQVSYTVSRQVPVTTVQKFPVQKTVYVDQTITAQEAYTVKKTVAVGTRTRMVYDSNIGGSSVSAQAEPTPAATASGDANKSAGGQIGTIKTQSYQERKEVPIQSPVYRRNPQPTPAIEPVAEPHGGPVATQPAATPSIARVVTWKATQRSGTPVRNNVSAPELVAQK